MKELVESGSLGEGRAVGTPPCRLLIGWHGAGGQPVVTTPGLLREGCRKKKKSLSLPLRDLRFEMPRIAAVKDLVFGVIHCTGTAVTGRWVVTGGSDPHRSSLLAVRLGFTSGGGGGTRRPPPACA